MAAGTQANNYQNQWPGLVDRNTVKCTSINKRYKYKLGKNTSANKNTNTNPCHLVPLLSHQWDNQHNPPPSGQTNIEYTDALTITNNTHRLNQIEVEKPSLPENPRTVDLQIILSDQFHCYPFNQ